MSILIDAVNSKSLKAWYKDYCNYFHPFTAAKENADEIYIRHTDFIEYLYSIFDELIKGNLGYTEKGLKAFRALADGVESGFYGRHRAWRPFIKNARMIIQAKLQTISKQKEGISTGKNSAQSKELNRNVERLLLDFGKNTHQ